MAIRDIYLVHHSHTDIGYTHPPSTAIEIHQRNIDLAIELAEASCDRAEGDAFRWTCEVTMIVEGWMRRAGSRQIDRFIELCKRGWIDVAALWCNFNPTFEIEQFCRALMPVKRLRDRGIPIRSAMNCDVNGFPWRAVDVLHECGISGLTMATNGHMGRSILARPGAFRWHGPAGGSLAVWNGYLYNDAWFHGIPNDIETAPSRIDAFVRQLESAGYPHPFLQFQVTYPDFSDNGPPDNRLSNFVTQWNARGYVPRLRIVTVSGFLDAVRALPLPGYSSDWPDAWAFGSGSCAAEISVNRGSHSRLVRADLLHSIAAPSPLTMQTSHDASYAICLFDEHSFGADESVTQPSSINTRTQWSEKSAAAYTGHALSDRLERDGMIQLAGSIEHGGKAGVVVFNPSAVDRDVVAHVPLHWLDPTYPLAESHLLSERGYGQRAKVKPVLWAGPMRLPAWGYRWVPAHQWTEQAGPPADLQSSETCLESPAMRVRLDPVAGGIISLFDKESGRELLDLQYGCAVRYVHETIDSGDGREAFFAHQWTKPNIDAQRQWKTDWPAKRVSDSRVVKTWQEFTPDAVSVVQACSATGVKRLEYRYTLYKTRPGLEIAITMEMTDSTEPSAIYFEFPLAVPDGTCRYEAMGVAVEAGREQLPDSCFDFMTVQRWIDLSNEQSGVTILSPDVPLWMWGGFHFGRLLKDTDRRKPLLVSWPANNYWDTNFRAHQPGEVRSRYVIIPRGAFDSAAVARHASVAVHPPLTMPTTGLPSGTRPEEAQLIRIQSDDVVPLALRRIDDNRLLLRLQNTNANASAAVMVGSDLLKIEAAGWANALGEQQQAIETWAGQFSITLAERQLATIILDTNPS